MPAQSIRLSHTARLPPCPSPTPGQSFASQAHLGGSCAFWRNAKGIAPGTRRNDPLISRSAEQVEAPDDASLDAALLRALILAFSASQNRSLTAARCLLETVLAIFWQGYTAADVESALAIAGEGRQPALQTACVHVCASAASA